jgi:hypothetical protein
MPDVQEQPELLEHPTQDCSVCGGTAFQVLPRNRNRRTEMLECVHSSQSWHRQAERLQLEIDATVSPSLKRLLAADLEQILTIRRGWSETILYTDKNEGL